MEMTFQGALKRAIEIWQSGGWAMWPLAGSAFILYWKAADVRIALWRKNFETKRSKKMLNRKAGSTRTVDSLRSDSKLAVHYLQSRGIKLSAEPTFEEISSSFEEARALELPPLNRDMKIIKVATAAAPLWGLLGTVTGMLETFQGLATGGGGDKTMNLVASGISQALITTETGLMIALPGYFFIYYLTRKKEKFIEFLAHLETATAQYFIVKPEEENLPNAQHNLAAGVT